MAGEAVWDDFERLNLRVGTILEVQPFPEARRPAYKLRIDLGEMGEKWSSAQVTDLYTPEQLVGKQVLVVAGFAPKRIAGFKSEVLVTGVSDGEGRVVLASPDKLVAAGTKLF